MEKKEVFARLQGRWFVSRVVHPYVHPMQRLELIEPGTQEWEFVGERIYYVRREINTVTGELNVIREGPYICCWDPDCFRFSISESLEGAPLNEDGLDMYDDYVINFFTPNQVSFYETPGIDRRDDAIWVCDRIRT